MLYKISKEEIFSSLKFVRFPKLQIFVEIFSKDLQSPAHQHGGRKIVQTSGTYFGNLGC